MPNGLQMTTSGLTKVANSLRLTGVWKNWRFSAPQTHLWLIKLWFSASTFVVKIATFPKLFKYFNS